MGYRKFGLLVVGAMISINSLAQVTYDLVSAKHEIISNNANVAIAYENYVRAQKEAKATSLALLPSFSVEIFLLNYQYLLLTSIIPDPSQFFTASASKELVGAADLNKLIVTRNILEDFEKNYFLHQMHKTFLPDLANEVSVLEEIVADTREAYELGAIDFAQYYQAKNTALSARTTYLNAEQLVVSDELAIKLVLGLDPETDILLEEEAFYNGSLDFPENVESGEEIALNNSKEIETYVYTIAAAKKMKKGVAISWLSWAGVGFDYFARNAVSKSNIRQLENKRTKAVYETKNQVSKLYKLIANQKEKIAIQTSLTSMAKENYDAKVKNVNDLRGTQLAVKEAQISFIHSQRGLTSMKYELEILYIQLKRILGTTMISNEVPQY